uniref:Peptidase_M13 domain-containing protein n=1 Tax=Steinernema glaseri TaxID=37863 RepID=A0A1I7ZTR9_9BILA
MVPFLLLGILAYAAAQADSSVFRHRFSSEVSPCEDFNEYVCNLKENVDTSWTDELQNRFMYDLLRHFNDYSDQIVDFVRQIYARDIIGTEFTHDEWFALNRRIILSNEAAPYINFVVPKLVRENGLWMPEETLAELKKVYTAVNEALVESIQVSMKKEPKHQIMKPLGFTACSPPYRGFNLCIQYSYAFQEQHWISQEQLEHVTNVIKNIEAYIYFPEAAKDPQNINTALSFFEESFRENLDALEEHILDSSCDSACLLDHLKSFMLSTLYKYIATYSNSPEYIHYWLIEGAPFAVGAWNSLGGDGKIAVLPAMSYYMNHTNLPRGLLYSTIAWQLGHELLHNLDSSKWGDRGATALRNVSRYESGFHCFANFYGSFVSSAPDGRLLFPNGELKQNEGFCDVEGFRVALKAVKKLLEIERDAVEVDSEHSDFEWFFLGAGLSYCHRANDYAQFVFLKDRPHPRFSVRINAVALQTPEFSEVFHCKPGDPITYKLMAGKQNNMRTIRNGQLCLSGSGEVAMLAPSTATRTAACGRSAEREEAAARRRHWFNYPSLR